MCDKKGNIKAGKKILESELSKTNRIIEFENGSKISKNKIIKIS
jgi:hypothetical protein